MSKLLLNLYQSSWQTWYQSNFSALPCWILSCHECGDVLFQESCQMALRKDLNSNARIKTDDCWGCSELAVVLFTDEGVTPWQDHMNLEGIQKSCPICEMYLVGCQETLHDALTCARRGGSISCADRSSVEEFLSVDSDFFGYKKTRIASTHRLDVLSHNIHQDCCSFTVEQENLPICICHAAAFDESLLSLNLHFVWKIELSGRTWSYAAYGTFDLCNLHALVQQGDIWRAWATGNLHNKYAFCQWFYRTIAWNVFAMVFSCWHLSRSVKHILLSAADNLCAFVWL